MLIAQRKASSGETTIELMFFPPPRSPKPAELSLMLSGIRRLSFYIIWSLISLVQPILSNIVRWTSRGSIPFVVRIMCFVAFRSSPFGCLIKRKVIDFGYFATAWGIFQVGGDGASVSCFIWVRWKRPNEKSCEFFSRHDKKWNFCSADRLLIHFFTVYEIIH